MEEKIVKCYNTRKYVFSYDKNRSQFFVNPYQTELIGD